MLAHLNRSVARIVTQPPGGVTGFRAVLDLEWYTGDLAVYAVILGHLAAGQAGDDAAAKRRRGEAVGRRGRMPLPPPPNEVPP